MGERAALKIATRGASLAGMIPRADPSAPSWKSLVLVTTGIGVLLGLLGPFGSFASPGLAWRIGYWVTVIWLGLVLYGTAIMLVMRRHAKGGWPIVLVTLIAASLPQALASRSLALAVWPELEQVSPGLAVWYLQVLLIAVVISVALMLWRRGAAQQRQGSDSTAHTAAPEPWPVDIIALQMEDHYVRIHRQADSRLVLITMRDAVARMARRDGRQVHRSWWVARDAVIAIEGDARRLRLRLVNGLEVPVARSQVAGLRASGWLAAA